MKYILTALLFFIIGTAILYLIGVFLSNQFNPLLWPVYGKIICLIFEFGILQSALDK